MTVTGKLQKNQNRLVEYSKLLLKGSKSFSLSPTTLHRDDVGQFIIEYGMKIGLRFGTKYETV
jgi:hypothetical protein